MRKNDPSQALGSDGVAALVPPEEGKMGELEGHAGLRGLKEPHLQHYASSTQHFHAGQGMGGGARG